MILQELVTLYRDAESPVTGETVADCIDRTPGTVRNQMQGLKALQLVESVAGPSGGYKPTASAYETLDLQDVDDPADVPLYHNGDRLETTTVEEIDLTSVLHPEKCRAEIGVFGSLSEFQKGDEIVVGPTPCTNLRVEGNVEGIDDMNSALVVIVDSIRAPSSLSY
jgi:predicted transcriptional regulator